MARFGNRGSIILIASMSGSITNKVCRSRCRARAPSLTPPSERKLRTTHGCHTTRANRPYYRWPGAWRASLDLKGFGSIRSRQATSTPRKCAFPCCVSIQSRLWHLWVVPLASVDRSQRLRGVRKGGIGLGRSRACGFNERELLTKAVYFYRMTAAYLDKQPHLLEKWSGLNPLGRLGRPDELRGVIAWLASDASTFCTGSE
jgi:hypothetical protein